MVRPFCGMLIPFHGKCGLARSQAEISLAPNGSNTWAMSHITRRASNGCLNRRRHQLQHPFPDHSQSKPFRSNSIAELHRHPAWRGKQNSNQAGREPNSFLGLPLKVVEPATSRERVIGVLKLEDILPSPNHPEPYFTEQDEILVGMMAHIIALSINTTTANQVI